MPVVHINKFYERCGHGLHVIFYSDLPESYGLKESIFLLFKRVLSLPLLLLLDVFIHHAGFPHHGMVNPTQLVHVLYFLLALLVHGA